MNRRTQAHEGRSWDADLEQVPTEYCLETYDYALPPELIAQEPLPSRDDSRLMVLRMGTGRIDHYRFADLPSLLDPSDVIVINETRVIPAMLIGRKASGGRVELLVLEPTGDAAPTDRKTGALRECLIRSSKPLRPGAEVEIFGGATVAAEKMISPGRVMIRFPVPETDLLRFLDSHGQSPLPPYIKPESRKEDRDRTRYQTVYATTPGSVAAPTAGLHFTDRVLDALHRRGIEIVPILLHVGPGTFMPVREADIRHHRMEEEYFSIPEESAARLTRASADERRLIAIGTTTVRALESATAGPGVVSPVTGRSGLFIQPGYRFKAVRGLLTNFHLPGSTLLMLVCAFAGTDRVLQAYREAIGKRYRFYSYGDACLILD